MKMPMGPATHYDVNLEHYCAANWKRVTYLIVLIQWVVSEYQIVWRDSLNAALKETTEIK